MPKTWKLRPELAKPQPIAERERTPAEHRLQICLLEHANDNGDQERHYRPTLNEARRNRLMPTPELNRAAELILRDLDGVVSATSAEPFVQGDKDADAWSWDSILEMGPTPEMLIANWQAGLPANDNRPRPLTGLLASALGKNSEITPGAFSLSVLQEGQEKRVQRRNRKTGVVTVKRRKARPEILQLCQVGRLKFDDKSRLVPKDRRGDDWFRGPRGQDDNRAASNVVQLDDCRGAAIPRLGVEFLAGKVSIHETSNYIANNLDATMLWQQREAAKERLRQLRLLLGADMSEALLDAATGCEPWRIGNGRGPKDWRAAARGKALVVEAIKILCDTTPV